MDITASAVIPALSISAASRDIDASSTIPRSHEIAAPHFTLALDVISACRESYRTIRPIPDEPE